MSSSVSTLTIGDLAERTGLSVAVLRSWEARHGFPRADRLPSGHRRYAEAEVALVALVQARRATGVRLDAAVAEAVAAGEDRADSIYAAIRRAQPGIVPTPLHRTTLLAFSWAIEDECASVASRPFLFGAFQTEENFLRSRTRWTDLARGTRATVVLADFDGMSAAAGESVIRVPLPLDSPIRREWAVVADAPDMTVALVAWEMPGQDRAVDRTFEAVWSFDAEVVRMASRACLAAAVAADATNARALQRELSSTPLPVSDQRTSALLGRLLVYGGPTARPH